MTKPNLKEIEWAISKLEDEESSESNYAMLAALYTCRNELLGVSALQPKISAYSEASAPTEQLGRYGNSEFLTMVYGKEPEAAWRVMDELMDTLEAVNVRLYNSVMGKLERI